MTGALNEVFTASGTVRPPYAALVAALERKDLAALGVAMAGEVASAAMTHGAGDDEHPFAFDPVPRMVAASEWDALAVALRQRVRALNAFFLDAHGRQAAVRAGVVPGEAIHTSPWHERDLLDRPPPAVGIAVAGPDVARAADGRLVVLEDNVRTPTMLAYAVIGRGMVERQLGVRPPGPEPLEVVRRSLRRMLAAAAPWTDEPVAAILGDGDANALHWEVAALGRMLELPVLELGDLRRRGERLVIADSGRPVDVLWRRTSEERLRDDHGRLNRLGEALLAPLSSGRLAVINAFGTGVADDKRILPYVEDLIRFFLGEEPRLASAITYDLTRPEALTATLDRLDELVVKPRDGCGGRGVLIGSAATRAELDRMRRILRRDPGRWVAQEIVALSTHPVVVEGRLEPRHVDLRPYVISHGDSYDVLPVAFARFAPAADDLVVNCSLGGGGKDVWIVP